MIFDFSSLCAADRTAKLARLADYERTAISAVPPGAEMALVGPAPVWLYLRVAPALHGRAKRLCYDSPITGVVEIFNHDPN
jgi:hypothetical protein